MKRAPAMSTALLSLTLLVAACSSVSGSGSTNSTTTVTATTTVTTTVTTAVTATPSSGGSTSGGSVRQCTQAQLTATTGQFDGAAGTLYLTLIFTNHSSSACTVQGYPGVAGLNGNGEQIAQATRDGSVGDTLTLAPGGSVSATVSSHDVARLGDFDQYCHDFDGGLAVTPPNTSTTVNLTDPTDRLPDCELVVSTVVPGTGN
jgi:hypothetical protein